MIYQELNIHEFREAFHKMGRGEQFSYDALGALYDYFDDIGGDYELDVIDICCSFTEYKSIDAFKEDHSLECESWDDVKEQALVFELENDGAVVGQF